MDEKTRILKRKVWGFFGRMQMVFLATCENDLPKVRPVMLIYYNERFWVATFSTSAKIRQIKNNQKVEFCMELDVSEKKGYVRGAGNAEIIEDEETRKLLASKIPFFKVHWKTADDENFTLLEIKVTDVEFMEPGKFELEKFFLADHTVQA